MDLTILYTSEREKVRREITGKAAYAMKGSPARIAGLLILEYGGFWQSFLWFWQFARNKLRITKFG